MNIEAIKIPMAYDRYQVPMSLRSISIFIQEEIKRLSDLTGLPGDKLPVKFDVKKKPYIACFVYQVDPYGNGLPIEFHFDLPNLSGISPRQLNDIIRHEFAPYVRLMRYGPHSKGNDHDELWQQICRSFGCPPSPYHTPHRTKMIHYN